AGAGAWVRGLAKSHRCAAAIVVSGKRFGCWDHITFHGGIGRKRPDKCGCCRVVYRDGLYMDSFVVALVGGDPGSGDGIVTGTGAWVRSLAESDGCTTAVVNGGKRFGSRNVIAFHGDVCWQ